MSRRIGEGIDTATDGFIVRGIIRADSGYLGSLSIDGILAIGASGEIRQGSGTLGSDFIGLRVWRDGSVGRIGGYNSNALQWYASTDGKLYAGGGSVKLDSNGIALTASTSSDPENRNVLKVVDGGGDPLLSIYVYDAVALGGIFRQAWVGLVCDDDTQSEAYLKSSTFSTTKGARCGLYSLAGNGGTWTTTSFNITSEYDATYQSLAELIGRSAPRLRLSATTVTRSTDIWLEDNGKVGLQNILSSGYMDLAEIASPGTPASGYGRLYVSSNTGNSPVYRRDTGGSHDIVTDEVQMPMTNFAPLQGAAWEGTVFGNQIPNRMKFPNNQSYPACTGGPFLIPATWSGLTVYFDAFMMVGTNNSGSINLGFTLFNCDDNVYTYNNPNSLTSGSASRSASWITYAIYKFTISLSVPALTRNKMVFAHLYRNSSDTYNNDVFFIGGKLRSYD